MFVLSYEPIQDNYVSKTNFWKLSFKENKYIGTKQQKARFMNRL